MTAVASLTRVRVMVDHTMPTPLQRSTKLEISHWYFLISVFTSSRLHLPSKTSWANVFLHNFFHPYPLNETFIVNGKFHCCNDTFTDVRFTSLLAKNAWEIYKLFLFWNQHFISYFVWNFHSNWLFFLRVMQENKSGCFFSEHSGSFHLLH